MAIGKWNSPGLLAFANGTLDTTTGQFTSGHRRDDWLTYCLPYNFDPIAMCPIWDDFLKQALKNDKDAIELVQAFFRWALEPKPAKKYDLEVCWDLYGKPGTGKGTLLDVLKQLVGIENCGYFSSASFDNPNALAGMIDKPVSIAPDDSGHISNPGRFNRAVSNEPIEVKKLYKDHFSTTLNTFLVRAYNSFISTTSAAQGSDRRIVAMTFDNIPDRIDEELSQKLELELSGIFNWAMSISVTEAKRRIRWSGNIEAVQKASTERFLFNNPAYEFLLEFYPDGGKAKIRDLHYHYSQWSNDKGDRPLGEKLFKLQLFNFGCHQGDKIDGICLMHIPPMKRENVVSHLRIAANTTDKNTIAVQENKPDLSLNSLSEDGKSLVHMTNIPDSQLDPVTVSSSNRDLRDLREIENQTVSDDEKIAKSQKATKQANRVKSNTSIETKIEPQPPKSNKYPNPKGTITYQRLLRGEIGTTVIKFSDKLIAQDWQTFIYQVFGYDGRLELMPETENRFNWKLSYEEFDQKAIERLEQKDLSKPVPKRS